MKEKLASIVIVTYYTGDLLWRVIESALIQKSLSEIIIINNGNPDIICKKLDELTQENNKLQVYHLENLGFAKACNLGVKYSKGEYVLLLNPDCVLKDENTLRKFIEYFNNNSKSKLGICKILNPDRTIQKTCIRKILTPKIFFTEGFFLHRIPILKNYVSRLNVDISNITVPTKVEAISGAFMMMRKADYAEISMDEGYFLHMEDMDLCKRVSDNGGDVFYLPQVEAIHYLSTSDVPSLIVEKYKIKSFLRYFKKFYNSKYIWIIELLLIIRYALLYVINKIKSLHPKILLKKLISYNKLELESDLFDKIKIHYNKKNIIVAGCTNQIGLLAVKKLLIMGYKIKALYKNSTINSHIKNIEWIQTDFNKKITLPIIEADTLIYTAPIWMLPNLLSQIEKSSIKRLICFSSTSKFTKSSSKSQKEKNIVEQLTNAENEVIEFCKEKNINYTILRPTMIYGLNIDMNVNFISKFIKKFGFFPIIGEGKGLRQPVHTEDLANAAIEIINNPNTYNSIYNLAGGERLSYKEMLKKIFEHAKIKEKIVNLSFLNYILFIAEKFFKLPFTSEMANRINQDMIFEYTEAALDFNYQPRKFLEKNEVK